MSGIQIAEKLSPYLFYLWNGLLILVCMTLLMGCVLVVRRAFTKQDFEGDPQYDNHKVAKEIHEEIQRLSDLRNRLDPSYQKLIQAMSAESAVQSELNEPGVGGAASMSEDEKKALEAILRAEFEKEISQLKADLEAAQKSTVSTAAPEPKVEEALNKQRFEMNQESEKLRGQVGHLERMLSEYRLFEDDFAQVKKLKLENEELRRLLEKNNTPFPSSSKSTPEAVPQVSASDALATETRLPLLSPEAQNASVAEVTENDIANLFEELKNSDTKLLEDPVEMSQPATKVASEEDKQSSSAGIEAAPSSPGETLAFVSPSGLAVNEATAEAVAETGDDELMAEFEKLLAAGQAKS